MIRLFDRMLTRYLRRRGWVVFWLDIGARTCQADGCWLNLYEQSEGR